MRTGYKVNKVCKAYKVIGLLYSLSFISLSLYGQVQNKEFIKKNFKGNMKAYKSAIKSIGQGEYYYAKGDHYYRYAIPYYLDAEKINPDNDLLNYKIGKCMIFSPYKEKAIPYLQKAIQLNPKMVADVHYYLARAYHLNMEWDKAKQEYTTYLQTLTPDRKTAISDVQKKIEECGNGKQLSHSPIRVFVDNVVDSINNEYSQYHPLVTANESEMIYTYRTPVISKGVKFDTRDGDEFEKLLVSYSTDGVWGPAKQLALPINTKQTNIATAGLSPDGQTLYLYRTNDNGDIYQSHLTDNKWAKPKPMGKNINSVGKESSITVSADGKTYYFTSDRPGGYGMGDIYMTTCDDKGKWSAPKNLGPVINTQYDEQGVYLAPDGNTLYFSSTGHNTMGGYDIFKSAYDSGHWSAPENMGYPINTPGDDMYFTMSANKKHAYYSSDQKGGMGDMDIYMVTFLGPEKPVMVSSSPNTLSGITSNITDVLTSEAVLVDANKALLRGVVVDSNTHTPLLASIELVDNKKNKVIANFKTDSITGGYVVSLSSGVNYGISVKAANHLFYSANVDLTDSSHYREIVKNVALQPLEIGSHIALRNIFFDFNKSTLRKESTAELQEIIDLLKQYPSITIEIAGYTDNKGTDKYNLNLSTARAKSVVTYLQTHGIGIKRLNFKGYGSANPVALNTTDEGRQLNRRTEFKITGK